MTKPNEYWRGMSIKIGPRSFPTSQAPEPRPYVLEWVRVNAEYVSCGAGKDRDRDLCEGGLMDGEPCKYPARRGRMSCGRKHD